MDVDTRSFDLHIDAGPRRESRPCSRATLGSSCSSRRNRQLEREQNEELLRLSKQILAFTGEIHKLTVAQSGESRRPRTRPDHWIRIVGR